MCVCLAFFFGLFSSFFTLATSFCSLPSICRSAFLAFWWILIYEFVSRPPINQFINRFHSNEFISRLLRVLFWLIFIAFVCLFYLRLFFFPSLLTYATPGLDTPRCGLLRLDAVTKNRIVVVISCLSGHTQLAASTTIQSNQHTTWFYTFLSTWSWSQQLFGILQALIVVVVQLVRTADCRIAELTVYRLVGRSNCRAAGQVESYWFRSTSPRLCLLATQLAVCTENFWFINNNSFSNATHIPHRPVSLLSQLVCHAPPRPSSFLANRHSMRCVRQQAVYSAVLVQILLCCISASIQSTLRHPTFSPCFLTRQFIGSCGCWHILSVVVVSPFPIELKLNLFTFPHFKCCCCRCCFSIQYSHSYLIS